jgi:hypothetical protein
MLALVFASGVCVRAQMSDHTQHEMEMSGLLGEYSATRESSGTSWQPEASPMPGIHAMTDDWMFMLHGFAFGVFDDQGGGRGAGKFFSANMLMGTAQHPLGAGTFGARVMLSLEPATIGREGYPLLLQTGEGLIDRQHPHDLFMELAMSYSVPVAQDGSVFAYFGMPGEPAIGPPTFMHRFSGMDNPEAPITHHWLDSTHITFGVATVGATWKWFKLDASVFTGREPDQQRWDFDGPRFDSWAARLTVNPTPSWSAQVSHGWLNSPEEQHPGVDTGRFTASISYHRMWARNWWATTFAWGRDSNSPGNDLDGFLLESTVNLRKSHTIFARAERVDKDELVPATVTVNKATLGYIYDFPEWLHVRWGIGGLGSIHVLPDSLRPVYGDTPLSFMLFARAKL